MTIVESISAVDTKNTRFLTPKISPSPPRARVDVHSHKQLFVLRHLHDPVQGSPESVQFPNRLDVCCCIPNNAGHSPSSTTPFKCHLQ